MADKEISVQDYIARAKVVDKAGGEKHRPNSNLKRRRYTLIAKGPNLQDKVVANISANRIKNEKQILKLMGYARFDQIEVESYVELPDGSELKRLEFGNPKVNFNRTPIPASPVEAKSKKIQLTLPWETLSNAPKAILPDGSKKLEIDRQKQHQKAEAKRAQSRKSIEIRNDSDKMIIWEKATGKPIFFGPEMEGIYYIKNHSLNIEDLILYIPSKTYNQIKKIEESRNA